MKVKNFATPNVWTIHPEETLLQAARAMREGHVGCLVVVESLEENPLPIGIVTDRDLVVEGMAQNLPPDSTVEEIMNEDLVTCYENDDIEHAIHLMQTNGIRRLPVVNHEHELRGILSFDDLLERDPADLPSLGDVPRMQRNWEREVRG